MISAKLNHGDPKVLESKRIKEIKSLSHLERLERMMVLIELSYKLKNAPRIYPAKK